MSFIKTSKQLYRQVEALEKETSDHEISMARGELETIADRALATSAMLEGTPDTGNPLPAWVQSKITNACDYITTVHDYLKYSPKLNEEFELTETTFEKIYQMQQDGKSVEDIAKELNLKADLVKKVLGESKSISEGLSDAQIAQLKKEYEPLKGKTITTSQYQQLKNILFKLQDGDLEKLQKQNIPFASTGAGSILRVRKAPVKITNVTVPGLEGMAEAIDMSKVTKYKMISIKGDQKEITIDREDLEKHLKLGYVIKEPITEESDKGFNVKYKMKKDDASISMSWYKDKELAQKFLDDVKKAGGNGIITAKEEIDLEEGAKRYKEMSNVGTAKYVVSFHDGIKKHNDGSDFFDVEIFKNKEEKNKFITDLDRKGYRPIKYVDEEVELKPVPSLEDSAKKHKVDVEVLKKQLEKGIQVEKEHTKDEKTAEKIALAHIDERPDYYDQLAKVEKQPVKESHFAIGQHVVYHGPKNPLTPIKAQIIGVATPQTGAYYQIKKDDGETTYASPEQMKLDEACWTGYKQVGLKKKNGKMVPNCVPEETIKEEKRLYIESIVAVKNKAEKSGMPYSVLKQVYDRGMAAWKGGHRPGATQVQWALARVNSFVTKSSGTWGGADSDLAKKVKGD
jgi:hypothetical protein